jgi:dTDP-4-amino-4,6-dideoxygalactose transaminase
MTLAEPEITRAVRVPLIDVGSLHRELEPELVAAFRQVLHSGTYILGPAVEAFEARAAQWLGANHCIAVSSGTDALLAALLALEIQPGDEVITSPLTFVSTAEAITRVNAKPVFADVCSRCLCLDPASVAARLTPHTRAIIPVHLYGELGHIEELLALAKDRGIFVVEDACQAFGSSIAGPRSAGTLGDVGCFSFFPTKVLGALGDAGLICTQDSHLADRLRSLRSHGRSSKHHFCRLGGNFRMDALQAALLRVLIDRADDWIAARGSVAQRYTNALCSMRGIRTPSTCMTGTHAWSVYTIRVEARRDDLARHLKSAGIETAIYYPTTLADQPLFQTQTANSSNLDHARRAATQVLSLPIHPGISAADQALVVREISDHVSRTDELHYDRCIP